MQDIVLSTAYFPPVSWIAATLNSGNTTIEIHETYPKQTFRNRCYIGTASGLHSLTVPVNRIFGNHTKTLDIQVDNSHNWQIVHWRSIVTAYNRSPYFLFYRDHFESLFQSKHERLIDLNSEVLSIVYKVLNIKLKDIIYTNEYFQKTDLTDLRNAFHPKKNSIDALDLEFPRYIQVFEEYHGFIPDLSILDLIFNLGPEAREYLLKINFPFFQCSNVLSGIQP
jgi:hypothetical protein